jgi:hypothetical protein
LRDLEFFRREGFIGEGKISIEEEEEDFAMVMKIAMKNFDQRSPIIEFSTSIHMDQPEECIENYYTLTMHSRNKFHILIAGEEWGHVEGSGFIKDGFIGWEVSSPDGLFHAYESIEMKGNKDFIFFGEYAAKEEMRTKIQCRLVAYENSNS